MNNEDLLSKLRDDAALWAAEFRKTAIELGYSDMDEGWLIGWFANAIENTEIIRRNKWKQTLDITAIEYLLSLVEEETKIQISCNYDPDDDPVGYSDYGPLEMTFGDVRRAREQLENLKRIIDE